jgi:hypothetical protein
MVQYCPGASPGEVPVGVALDFLRLESAAPSEILGKAPERGLVPNGRKTRDRLLVSVMNDIERTLGWFEDEFSDPVKTSIRLKNSDKEKSSAVYQAIEYYLKSVANNNHQEDLDELKLNCSAYTKKLFFS